MECYRDKALRAKEIAEKKFTAKDIMGAKKFALKAQHLYPELEGISQMLATFDVYLSAENKTNGETDWYAVLSVNASADDKTVKKQYRKFALNLHPNQNKCIGAEGAFKLLSEAWSVLSDKDRRTTYDKRINIRRDGHRGSQLHGDAPASTCNGFYNFANTSTQKATSQAPPLPKPSAAPPTSFCQPKPNTFWTVCGRCKMRYEYRRVYLNHNLRCVNCHEPFMALEIAHPKNDFHDPSRSSSCQQSPCYNSSNKTNVGAGKSSSAGVPSTGTEEYSCGTGIDLKNVPLNDKVRREREAHKKHQSSKRTFGASFVRSSSINSSNNETDISKVDKATKRRRGFDDNGGNDVEHGYGVNNYGSDIERVNTFSRATTSYVMTQELSMHETRDMLLQKSKKGLGKKISVMNVEKEILAAIAKIPPHRTSFGEVSAVPTPHMELGVDYKPLSAPCSEDQQACCPLPIPKDNLSQEARDAEASAQDPGPASDISKSGFPLTLCRSSPPKPAFDNFRTEQAGESIPIQTHATSFGSDLLMSFSEAPGSASLMAEAIRAHASRPTTYNFDNFSKASEEFFADTLSLSRSKVRRMIAKYSFFSILGTTALEKYGEEGTDLVKVPTALLEPDLTLERLLPILSYWESKAEKLLLAARWFKTAFEASTRANLQRDRENFLLKGKEVASYFVEASLRKELAETKEKVVQAEANAAVVFQEFETERLLHKENVVELEMAKTDRATVQSEADLLREHLQTSLASEARLREELAVEKVTRQNDVFRLSACIEKIRASVTTAMDESVAEFDTTLMRFIKSGFFFKSELDVARGLLTDSRAPASIDYSEVEALNNVYLAQTAKDVPAGSAKPSAPPP